MRGIYVPGIVESALSAGPIAGLFYGLGVLSGPQLASRMHWSWSVARNRFGSTLLAGGFFAGPLFVLSSLYWEGPLNAASSRVVIPAFEGLIGVLLAALINGVSLRTGPVKRASG
jgi:hypothetical protein